MLSVYVRSVRAERERANERERAALAGCVRVQQFEWSALPLKMLSELVHL